MHIRLDLHLHTFFSRDAVSSPEKVIAAARNKGLHGIAITDHDSCEATKYLRERGLASADGEPVDGFLVIPAVEVSTAEGHLLCLGVVLPNMKHAPAAEVCDAVHEQGGLAIAAHPYDYFRAGIREDVLDALPLDGIEVFNAAVTLRSFNADALRYAEKRGLAMTASSDAHHAGAVGTASTMVDAPGLNVHSVLEAIKAETTRDENYLSFWEGFKKHACNWIRIFNPRPEPHDAYPT